ncbi:MAG: hypothetical protein LIO92_13060 [Clostridiales bacterium]|nr:hypothetical protein [Clostridiales bacterium]
MATIKMVLADESEIELSEFTLPMHAVVVCAAKDDVVALWDKLTEENLSSVQIYYDGVQLYVFTNGSLNGQQTVTNTDGTLTAHFYMDGERVETEYEQAGKILLGEE